jgi:hypothetical protein
MNHKKNFQAIAKSLAGPIAGKPTTNAKSFLLEYCEQFDGIQVSFKIKSIRISEASHPIWYFYFFKF